MSSNSVGYTESMTFRCLEDLEQTYELKTTHPLVLLYCGREDCESGWCFGPYVRENYVIHVVTGGCGVYKVDGKVFHLSAGQAFVIYPGIETIYQADPETPWSYMWIGFNGLRARNVVDEIGFSRKIPVITLDDTKRISNAIDYILDARELTPVNELKRSAAFHAALALLMEMNTHKRMKTDYSDDRYVNTAVDLIVRHYNERIKVSEIADKVGINRSYLTSIFKKEMHMSPQEFLINFRLEKAAQMLRDTEEPIGSIASAVGYTDPLTFSKAFRKKYDESPSEYRAGTPELSRVTMRGGYDGLFRL